MNILRGKRGAKTQGNQFWKQICWKRKNLKMLIFHWFLQYNMHVRLLHTLSKFKLARARRGIENVQKISIHRKQKIEKIDQNLSKLNTKMKFIQKTSSEADFYKFWLDFGVPRRPQNHQKLEKNNPKN